MRTAPARAAQHVGDPIVGHHDDHRRELAAASRLDRVQHQRAAAELQQRLGRVATEPQPAAGREHHRGPRVAAEALPDAGRSERLECASYEHAGEVLAVLDRCVEVGGGFGAVGGVRGGVGG